MIRFPQFLALLCLSSGLLSSVAATEAEAKENKSEEKETAEPQAEEGYFRDDDICDHLSQLTLITTV